MYKETEFLEELKAELQSQLGESVVVQSHVILRNNGGESRCLTILPPGKKSSPALWMEPYFQRWARGEDVAQLALELLREWRSADQGKNLEELTFEDYQQVKRNIYRMAVNRDKNRKSLENQPWKPFLDWALVCYYRVDRRLIPEAIVRIEKHHLDLWGISEEELFQQAWENCQRDLPPRLYSMGEILGIDEEEFLYVLTNEKRYLGAEVITRQGALEEICKKVDGDFYVLPSSIHECLVLPVSQQFSKESLSQLVKEINETQVDSTEVLSDQAYLYRRDLKKLCL